MEKKIISYLIEDGTYTVDELTQKIGTSKRTTERALTSLKNKDIIERIGSKRNGRWIVVR